MRRPIDRDRQVGDVGAADRDAAAARPHQAREQQRELVLAAAALADDRDMLGGRDGEAHPVDDPRLLVLDERQVGDRHLADQRRHGGGLVEQQLGVDHPGRLELLDDLLVGDLRICLDLVVVEQLLPRRAEILVGGEHRDQRAERQAALDDQIAADREEEERRQLADEVVEELHEEFAVVDLEPDVVDHAEDMSEIGQLQLDRIVGVDLDDAGGGFLDPVGDLAHGAHAALLELVDSGLQLAE